MKDAPHPMNASGVEDAPHPRAIPWSPSTLSPAGTGERVVLVIAALFLSGCVGMKVNESAVRDRAEKAKPGEPGVVEITPKVLAKLRTKASAAAAAGVAAA